MGIENRFQLRTCSNWLNPSTSFAIMLHDSLIDAVCASQNNDVELSGEAVGENNNKGAEGAITTESDGLKRQKRSLSVAKTSLKIRLRLQLAASAALCFYARVGTPATCRNISQCCNARINVIN